MYCDIHWAFSMILWIKSHMWKIICTISFVIKIGRPHKETGEPIPYEKNDNVMR